MENWKSIDNEYQVSDIGRVRRLWVCSVAKPELSHTEGMWNARVYFAGERKYLGAHTNYEDAEIAILTEVDRLNSLQKVRKYLAFAVDKDGYFRVHLLGSINRFARVNRLVAQAFIPNPEGLPIVNHKNVQKQDNRVGNLEWVTVKDNNYHAYSAGIFPDTHTMKSVKRSDGVSYVNSVAAAVGLNDGSLSTTTLASGIRKAMRSGKTYKGFYWCRTFND